VASMLGCSTADLTPSPPRIFVQHCGYDNLACCVPPNISGQMRMYISDYLFQMCPIWMRYV